MANITETATFHESIYRFDANDLVLASTDPAIDIDNKQAQALADRTLYLKQHVDALEIKRIFGGSVTVPSQTFLTVTHNKGIPVINQSISLTRKTTNSTAVWLSYEGSDGSRLEICDQTTNSFKIYAENANDNVLVDWLLFDNR